MAFSFAYVYWDRLGAFRIVSMSLANQLVSFVSLDTAHGPDADPAVARRRVRPCQSSG